MNILLCSAACLAIGVAPKTQRESAWNIRVTPTEFFSGELKRLKPHLDFTAAECFKIKIKGPVELNPDFQLWRNGKRVDIRKYGMRVDKGSDELTFTVRRLRDTKKGVVYRVRVGGLLTFGRYFEQPPFGKDVKVAFGPICIEKPIELKPGADPVIVWAMGVGHGFDLTKPKEAEIKLRKSPWVLVLRLSAENDK